MYADWSRFDMTAISPSERIVAWRSAGVGIGVGAGVGVTARVGAGVTPAAAGFASGVFVTAAVGLDTAMSGS